MVTASGITFMSKSVFKIRGKYWYELYSRFPYRMQEVCRIYGKFHCSDGLVSKGFHFIVIMTNVRHMRHTYCYENIDVCLKFDQLMTWGNKQRNKLSFQSIGKCMHNAQVQLTVTLSSRSLNFFQMENRLYKRKLVLKVATELFHGWSRPLMNDVPINRLVRWTNVDFGHLRSSTEGRMITYSNWVSVIM